MDAFLGLVETTWPEIAEKINLVREERDTHNKFCLLYTHIINRFLVLKLRNGEAGGEKVVIAWFRLISTAHGYHRYSFRPTPKRCNAPREDVDACSQPESEMWAILK